MWTVIKIDKKKLHLFEEDIKKKMGNNCLIYRPKILIEHYKNNRLIKKEVNLLGDYIFCFHKDFKKHSTINDLKFLRGLKYFLGGFLEFQSDLKKFIEKCKNLEDKSGYILQSILEVKINSNYKFTSGPFVGKIFKILDLQKSNIKILIGNLNTTVNKKEFLFNPV